MQRLTALICFLLLAMSTFAAAQAPTTAPAAPAPDDAFAQAVDLSAVRMMSVQHNQTLKTFDTYARDVLFNITARTHLDDKPAAFVVIDMALRPEKYYSRNLIYIRNKPFREDFRSIPTLKNHPEEARRIVEEGVISLAFWLDPHVQADMQKMMSTAMVKADAIGQINGQAAAFAQLIGFPSGQRALHQLPILPPLDSPDANARPWLPPQALYDDAARLMHQAAVETPASMPSTIAGYSPQVAGDVLESLGDLRDAWVVQNAESATAALARLSSAVEQANPSIYPSPAKRRFELLYNSLYRLNIPAVAFYFVGFVLFLLYWRTELKGFYTAALVATIGGWLIHVASIAIRWWLVEKSVGNWFESIPIKNQFESVLMSAFFGVTVALLLERWKRVGLFGAAAACVGMLSLVAIHTAPYITGRDIGGEIRQNAGILMTYWLYIHVTLVTASYALIGMTFVLGVWYVVQYLAGSRKDRGADTADTLPAASGTGMDAAGGAGGAVALSYSANTRQALLKTIDDCNLIMLQLAFWILGIGIITGALWADVSWGRPWGWDPKETFALITWIVYLVIIHIRFITAGQKRALVTSVLSVVGFGVMLFNWIGVNFFLVGLHSYA